MAVDQLTEHLFRNEWSKLVSVLTGIFGIERLQLVEDAVQDALMRAFQTWPYDGVPANPTAWLMQTARNRALDVIRREKSFRAKEPEIIATIEQGLDASVSTSGPAFDEEIKDGRLRLIFACCHPSLPPEAQTALALKTLCAFSPSEIARAFLTTEAAIAKRLTRARQRLQEEKIPFEIPVGPELPPRLDGVRQTIYLLFNEGHKASEGEALVRPDLCHEAIRLANLLVEHPAASQPATHALLALMLLNAARLPARTDVAGNILRLEEQDREKWDRPQIALGLRHLRQASAGDELSEYHIQAGIEACHCTAPNSGATDWRTILAHYDQWLRMTNSPIVALNRAVAVANVRGPAAGIEAVESIANRQQLDNYHLTFAVLGELEAQRGNRQTASAHFQQALDLAVAKSEQEFLARRLRECAGD